MAAQLEAVAFASIRIRSASIFRILVSCICANVNAVLSGIFRMTNSIWRVRQAALSTAMTFRILVSGGCDWRFIQVVDSSILIHGICVDYDEFVPGLDNFPPQQINEEQSADVLHKNTLQCLRQSAWTTFWVFVSGFWADVAAVSVNVNLEFTVASANLDFLDWAYVVGVKKSFGELPSGNQVFIRSEASAHHIWRTLSSASMLVRSRIATEKSQPSST